MTERQLRLAVCLLVAGAGCSNRPLRFPGGPGGSGSGDGNGNGGSGGNGDGNGGSGGSGGNGNGGNGGTGGNPGAPPRLVAPLSTATVTSRRPRLRWSYAGGGAAVDLCADRGCASALGSATVDASGSSAVPDADLPVGPVFWRVHAGGLVSATWELFAGHRSAPVDTSYGATLDLDGDGLPDVAVKTAGSAVAVYLGGAAGLARAPLVLAAPNGGKDEFGYALAAAGDLNGDGYGDLVVGECRQDGGLVHVYLGGPGGPPPTPAQSIGAPDGATGFGCRVAGAGDLDGDGYADLAVARVGVGYAGGLYIFKGGPGGLPAMTTRLDSPDYAPSRLGYSLAGVGDVDGDGYADLAATEVEYSALTGRVHLYRGGLDGISNQRVVTLYSPDESGLQFGASVAGAGDVNGDGYADFVVGAPAVPQVKVTPTAHLYLGGPGGLQAGAVPTGLTTSGATGFAVEVEGGGDLDGDGYGDVVVSSPGGLSVYLGSAAGLSSTGTTLEATGQGSNPRHLAGVGDLDGDGAADLVVADGGGVEALRGGPGGPDRKRPGGVIALAQPPGGSFGSTVARASLRRAHPSSSARRTRATRLSAGWPASPSAGRGLSFGR